MTGWLAAYESTSPSRYFGLVADWLQVEVAGVEVRDDAQIVRGEIGQIRGGGELFELLDVVDVGLGRGDDRIGQHPLEGRLPEGHAALLVQERERLDLLEPLDQPGAGPVAAVVARRKDGIRRVLAFEHAGRVRHPHEN